MNDRQDGVRGDVTNWLAAGPEHAPSGLLGRALERTGKTTQRSAIVATALGAPTGRTTVLSPAVRIWLAAALAILALVTVIAVIGSQRHDPVVVLPSVRPSQPVTTDAAPTPGPSDPGQPAAEAKFFGGALGVVVPGGASAAESSTQDFARVNITADAFGVVIDQWPLGQMHAIPGLGGNVGGATFDELAASTEILIRDRVGLGTMSRSAPTVDFHQTAQWLAVPIRTDGNPNLFAIVIAVSGDKAYSITGSAKGSETGTLELVQFESMIGTTRFLEQTDAVGLDGRIYLTLPGTVHVETTTPELLTIANDGGFFGAVRLTIGHATLGDTITIGPLPVGPKTVTIDGTDLDGYADSLQITDPALFSAANRSVVEVDGQPGYQWSYLTGQVFIDQPIRARFTIVAVGSDVFTFLGDLGTVDTIRFSPPLPPPPGTTRHRVKNLEVTLPDDWSVNVSGTSMQLTPAGGGGFFAITQEVSVLDPDETFTIQRPLSNSTHERFEITGGTLDELVASINAGLGDATQTSVKIGGADGFRWAVPQTSVVRPLVAVAVVEWHDVFYVFVEHLPLDGSPGAWFDTLLTSVALL